jgi:hypothetical protein
VLIHAGVCAGFFRPLIEQDTLTRRCTVLRYLATHLLHVQNPAEMAEALTEFFSRHPRSDQTVSSLAPGRS